MVGAGPAGLTVALTVAQSGRSVVLLESGSDLLDSQHLSEGDHLGVDYVGLRDSRHRQIGGTANIWNVEFGSEPGAKYSPLDPHDLDDWPVAWTDLVPHYEAAQNLCGLGPFAYGASDWASAERQPFDLSDTGLKSAVYQFGSAARFTSDLPTRLSALENVDVITGSTVVGVHVHGGTATVTAMSPQGPTTVGAERLVLAAGAVENARLLLLAEGLERSQWLGRGFMEHARDFSLTLEPRTSDTFRAATFYDAHLSTGGVTVGGRLGLDHDAMVDLGLPNAAVTLFPRPSVDLLSRVRRRIRSGSVRAGPYGWSPDADRPALFRDFRLIVNVEQRPRPDNRIDLSERRDAFGNPLPRLHLTWTDQERSDLEQLRALIGRGLSSAGIGTVVEGGGDQPDLSAHHHAGTTRMADNIGEGVVDVDGLVFGTANLYCAGASVFPSAGFANPTLTIVAMAHRLAVHLAQP